MKKQILGLALFAATATVVAFYPAFDSDAVTTAGAPVIKPADPVITAHRAAQRPRIEVVFALDTTGSMGGLIAAAKEKIWSIATTMAQAQPAPEIRMGLVAYRDRGDAYVTQVVDLSSDLDSMYARLMDFRAAGGGDGPESVNQALDDAVERMSWSNNDNTYKVVFLVGDAPPHMDYANERQYPQIVAMAQQRGIVINAIRCGNDDTTRQVWQTIASASQGDFFDVDHDGSAVAVVTPFDASIAELSKELDDTRMAFGDKKTLARHEAKQQAAAKLHAKASTASRARRAAFNASASGKDNFLGDSDLVDAVTSGRLDLEQAEPDTLPAPLRAMAPAEREVAVKEQARKREDLNRRISELAGKRDAYIEKQVAAEGGAAASLDEKIYGAVRRQALGAGLSYDAAAKF